jgi:putative PEP-CTERM system TPR-repeat lipoprotein
MTTMRGLPGQRRSALVVAMVLSALVALTGCDESVERLVAEARALHDSGNFPAAVIKLNAALAQDPKNLPARLLSAQIYIDLARGDAALGLLLRAQRDGVGEQEIARPRAEAELVAHRYEDVIKQTDAPPAGLSSAAGASLLAYRGAALAALGREADARSALEQGLALDPHSIDVRIAAARLAIERGDLDAARRELVEATRDAPKDRRLTQLRGEIAYDAQDYPAAEQIYQEILDAEPWNQATRGELAAVQVAENKLPEAIANLDKVLKDPELANVPMHPILSYIRAVAAFQQTDYEIAQTNAATVVTRVPGFGSTWLIAGASSYALHQYEQAYYYLSPYVSQNPDDIRARKLLAETQLQLDRPGEAAKTLAPLRDNATEDPELLRLIGVAATRNGDPAAADRYLKLALARQPDDGALRTELGLADIAAGDPKAGIDNLEQVVKARPDASEPQIPLFVAFMQTKQYDKALAIAEQMIKRRPNSPTGELLASTVYLIQGNVSAGRAALLKAREIHPGDVSANRSLATLALADGNVDEARRYYQDILDADPHNTQSYVALAELDAKIGHQQEAEAMLIKGVQANPTDSALSVALLRLQLARGEAQEALAGGQQVLKTFPRNPAVLDVVGRAELAVGQRDAALSTFRDLVNIAPQAAFAHTGLAEAYLAQYTPDNPQWPAINEATEAVKLDPHDRAAKLVLARALTTHGRFDEASEVVDELKTTDPNSIDVIELEGLAAQGQRRPADAAAAFARAAALKDAAGVRRLADTEMRLGQPDDAAKTLKTWLDAHPEDTQTRKIWADICVKDGRLAEAGEQYAELVRREPKNPIAQNNLAWLFSQLGQANEALDHARTAVALAPQSVDFLDTLGGILLRSGNPAAAVDPLDKAWQKDTHRPDVGFHLSQALADSGKKTEALALLRRLLADHGPFAERVQAQDLLRQVGG